MCLLPSDYLGSPLADLLLPVCQWYSCTGQTKTGCSAYETASEAPYKYRERITSLRLHGYALANITQDVVGLCCKSTPLIDTELLNPHISWAARSHHFHPPSKYQGG